MLGLQSKPERRLLHRPRRVLYQWARRRKDPPMGPRM